MNLSFSNDFINVFSFLVSDLQLTSCSLTEVRLFILNRRRIITSAAMSTKSVVDKQMSEVETFLPIANDVIQKDSSSK